MLLGRGVQLVIVLFFCFLEGAMRISKIATTADGKTVLEVAGRPAFELNRVALSIWTSLEAGQSPEEISSQIASEFKAPGELAARDVTRFIKKLKDNLLVYDEN